LLTGGVIGAVFDLAAEQAQHHHNGIDVNILPGQTYYFKVRGDPTFGMHLQAVSKEQGRREIQNCHWKNPH
jgi:hypothetical protein